MLSVGSALLLLFSEKIPSNVLVYVRRVDADVDPDFCARRFNDVDIRSVKRTDTARGRFTVLLGLTRDEHLFFYLSRKSRLAGDFGYVVSDSDHVVPSGIQGFVAACVSSEII